MPGHLLAGLEGACSSQPGLQSPYRPANEPGCGNALPKFMRDEKQGDSQPATRRCTAALLRPGRFPATARPPLLVPSRCGSFPPLWLLPSRCTAQQVFGHKSPQAQAERSRAAAAFLPPVCVRELLPLLLFLQLPGICACVSNSPLTIGHRRYRLSPHGEQTTAKMTRKHS